ncbi:MAG TPA: hypothetical protein DIW31_08440 [Bacteroidales bacterium]|nr:hypothetical protein [Bacteroidales bacterium]
MNYHEKRSLVSAFSSIIILGIYSLYIYQKYIAGNVEIVNNFKFWGKSFLFLIPVSIVAQIIIHIIFAIINKIATNEEEPNITDERDKLIELKSIRISHWIFITGFFLAMGSLTIPFQPYVMFITLIFSGFLSAIASEFAKVYYYRKGV